MLPLRLPKFLLAEPSPASRRQAGGWIADLVIAAGSVAGLVLVGAAAVLLARRRRAVVADELLPKAPSPAPAEEADLGAVAAEAPGHFDIQGDPRRAVIGCYAQMERTLARAGAARRPSEAPLEYCGRILVPLAPVDGRVLTELFERAMFSTEPMGTREKNRAIEALEAVQRGASA